MVDEVTYYLQPLVNYINNITGEQRSELKGFLGGGADTKFWRSFQKVIAEVHGEFCPEGLQDYIENETKQYNTEPRDYICSIENVVKEKIAEALEEYYGDNWVIKGIPKSVYKRAKGEADEKNYELISNDEESDISEWDCVTLKECRDIVQYGKTGVKYLKILLQGQKKENRWKRS